MSKVIADFKCGCFRKSTLEQETTFESQEEAMKEAVNMIGYMENNFCATHSFSIEKNQEDIIIKADINTDNSK